MERLEVSYKQAVSQLTRCRTGWWGDWDQLSEIHSELTAPALLLDFTIAVKGGTGDQLRADEYRQAYQKVPPEGLGVSY